MKQTTILLASILLFASLSMGQFTAQITNQYKTSFDAERTVKVGDKYVMSYYYDGQQNWEIQCRVLVRIYDSSMSLVKEIKMSDGKRDYKENFVKTYCTGQKAWLVYQEGKWQNNKGCTMAVEVDTKNLTTGQPKIIGATSELNKSIKFTKNVQMKSSPDSNYYLLLNIGDKDEYYFSVLDRNMTRVWDKTGTVAGKSTINDVCIDNGGAVYMSYKQDSDPHNGHIKIYTQKSEKDIAMALPANISPHNLQLTNSKAGKDIFIFGGFYNGEKYNQYYNGVFLSTLNIETQAMKGKVLTPVFPDTLIAQFTGDGWGSTKKDGGVTPVAFKLLELDNGAISLAAGYYSSSIAQYSSISYAGSMLNILVKDGNAVYTRIPRYRVSAGTKMGEGFYAYTFKNRVYFLYNDNPEHLKEPISQKANRSDFWNQHEAIIAIIDATGKVERKLLLDPSKPDESGLCLTDYIFQLADNSLLTEIYKGSATLRGSKGTSKPVVINFQ